MSLNLTIPKIGTPFSTDGGQHVSREWYLFLAGLIQVLGGPTVNPNVSPIVPVNVSLTSSIVGTLPVTNGGTGIANTNANALLYAPSANTVSSLTVGNSAILLSSALGAPSWGTTLPPLVVNGTVTATTIVGTTVSAVTVSGGTVLGSTVSAATISAATALANLASVVTVSAITITAGSVSTGALTIGGTAVPFSTGTFTPTIQGSTAAGTGTYTAQQGNFMRVGNRCFFNARVDWSATTGTGNTQIAGFPFTANSTANSNSSLPVFTNLGIALATSYVAVISPSNAFADLYSTAAGVGDAAVPLQASGSVIIAGSYLL